MSAAQPDPPTLDTALAHYQQALGHASDAALAAARLKGGEGAVADAAVAQAWAMCGELALSLHYAAENGDLT